MTKRAPPFVAGGRDSAGRWIRPTVVLNAETVWRVLQVVEWGPDWFRSFGTAAEPGPRLVSVNGPTVRGVVLETEAGAPMAELLSAIGGLAADSEAVLVGGLGGSFVPADVVPSLTWSTAALARFGAGTGPGVIELIEPRECPIALVDRFLAYASGESAGQCGPCMFGVPALAAEWHRFAERPSALVLQDIWRRAGLLPGRGACRFPDGVARFVASARQVYGEHLEGHLAGYCLDPGRRAADVLAR
jgi:NADH:ubiquinone oxidoreductase subunit F (NADH-binding)